MLSVLTGKGGPRVKQQERAGLASIPDVAEYLAVPVKTIYKWRSVGSGPPGIRVGRFVRFRWSDVDRWLERHQDSRKGPA